MLKHLGTVILGVALIYILLVYFSQRELMYFPAKQRPNLREFDAEGMQQVSLLTSDHMSLNAWYKAPVLNKPSVLILHGNAGHIGNRMNLASQLFRRGFGVLLLDYRGYGGNPGKPTEQGLYADGRAAMDFLKRQGGLPAKVVLYGESLGTGIATQLAKEFSVCALILQSPYTSMTALARYHYPWIFLPPWDKYDSLARITSIHTPLLILHGEEDDIVPYSHGVTLFNKANEPKRFLNFPHKKHNNLWNQEFFSAVSQFINDFCSY